jgi:hypothetical protein
MLVEELTEQFKNVKNCTPSHVNELLDYLQKRYISGELSIVEYKKIFSELHKLNAEKPSEFFIKIKPFFLKFDLSC